MRSSILLATVFATVLMGASGCHKTAAPEPPAKSAVQSPPATRDTPDPVGAPGVRQLAAEGAMCGGFAGIACQEGLHCAMEAGRCSVADDAGTCQRTPDVCTEQYAPVCGCDGKTYGNSCVAAMAGAKIDQPGECPTSG